MTRNQRRRNNRINRLAARVRNLGWLALSALQGQEARATGLRPWQVCPSESAAAMAQLGSFEGGRYCFPTELQARAFARACLPAGGFVVLDRREVRTYNPSDVRITFNGKEIRGFAPGSDFVVTRPRR